MYDKDFPTAAADWKASLAQWEGGERQQKAADREYWEWEGGPPKREYYRPLFAQEATAYQIYETVSEGTPYSPVFLSLGEIERWLIAQGHSEHASREFVEHGWAPSLVVIQGGPHAGVYGPGIDSLDAPLKEDV